MQEQDIKYAMAEILSSDSTSSIAPFCYLYIRDNKGATSKQIAWGTWSTKPTTDKRLAELVDMWLVEQRGTLYYIEIKEEEVQAVDPIDSMIEDMQQEEKPKVIPKYQFANEKFKNIKDTYSKHGLIYILDKKDRQALYWIHNRKTYEYTEPMKERLSALGVDTFEDWLDTTLAMRTKLKYTNSKHSVDTLSDVYRNFSNIYNKFNQDWHTLTDTAIDETKKAREIVGYAMQKKSWDNDFRNIFAGQHVTP